MFNHPSIDDYQKKTYNFLIYKKKNPLISVVTISKNSEKTIEKTINSLREQTSKNFEYIIVDSDSNDRTIEIINNNRDVIDKLISEKDKNPSDGINKGISVSEGKLIFWLASDDWINKDLIKTLEENYFENKNCSFFYGNMVMHYKDKTKIIYPKKKFSEQMLKGIPEFTYPSILFNKHVFSENGLFSTEIKINNDFEFILRILKKELSFKYINEFNVNRLPGGIGEKYKITNLLETLKINIYHKTLSLYFFQYFIGKIFYFFIIFIKQKLKKKLF